MDSHTLSEKVELEFLPGASVIYAMHGKCQVVGTETRSLDGTSIQFYKLEVKRSTFSRTGKQDPAIWVPVASAKILGLRNPMTLEDAEAALKILLGREYFFNPAEQWSVVQPKLEQSLRTEGGVGLAKVASFLHVLKRKQIVPTPEVTKLQESVQRLLFRELSDALNQPIRVLEEKILKGFKSKLIPDN